MVRRTKVVGVLTVLALVLVVTVPATAAQSGDNWGGNGNDGNTEAPTETFVSGTDTNNAGSVTGGKDNSNTCAAQENFNNSGGVLNQTGLRQDATNSNSGPEFLAPTFTNAPQQSAPCAPTVQQAASSSSGT